MSVNFIHFPYNIVPTARYGQSSGSVQQDVGTMQVDANLTAKQVATILGISLRQFEYLLKDGRAPMFLRIGRLRKWRPADVEAWLSKQVTARVSEARDA